MKNDPFQEYEKEKEPDKAQRAYAWHTAIGLQAVDGLKTSEYLIDTALQNIEGQLSIKEAKNRIHAYYAEKKDRSDRARTEEADIVSARIAEMLSESAFSFSIQEYVSIHRRLFKDIYPHAGKMRTYNITKKEWILEGDTVFYGNALDLEATLRYDFSQEKEFSYLGLSMKETLHHLACFISRLWQIHIFGEGNTRTTAVFLIKYLRSLGFSATNTSFAENAWYFRNALVRANYTHLQKGIYETTEFLERFLENLLFNKNHVLRNRDLHVQANKVDIERRKVDIYPYKVDMEDLFSFSSSRFSKKTKEHVHCLFEHFGLDTFFGRNDLCTLLHLKPSSVSKLTGKLLEADLIEPVRGHGKGKYKLKIDSSYLRD